jgi:hypothetical protein
MREEERLLLRLWRNGAGLQDWRASLEDLRTREKVSFARLKDLLHYLDTHQWRHDPGPEKTPQAK